MDSSRLISVLAVLQEEIPPYERALTALINALETARSQPNQDHSKAVGDAKESLFSILHESAANDFPPSRKHIFEHIGAADLFGNGAADQIEEILSTGISGTGEIVRNLTEFRNRLKRLQDAVVKVSSGFESLGIDGVDDDKPRESANEAEVGIGITRFMSDGGQLSGLTEYLEEWNRVLRTFAEVSGEEEREVEVRSFENGSFWVFALAGLASAGNIASAIENICKLWERVRKIRAHREGLAELEVLTEEPDKIRGYERDYVNRHIDSETSRIMAGASSNLSETRRNELTAAVHQSLETIAEFIDLGGDVEVTPPTTSDETEGAAPDEEATDAARIARTEIRRLGAAVAKLPAREEPILQIGDGSEGEAPAKGRPRRRRRAARGKRT